MSIQGIDAASIHRLTSGQVVTDLQTCVKELVENSLDAGATNIEVRFKNYGLTSVEVIDNGSGIAPADYDSVALKHHTSKLLTFEDIASIRTFGFRGEALSSLCALCESLTMLTATEKEAPMGTILEFDTRGRVKNRSGKAARQHGTTVTLSKLFAPLPVRRKDLEKNAKREFGKALNLLHAYALVPCSKENGGVRLTVSNQLDTGGRKMQFQTKGNSSIQSATTALWGPKAIDNIVPLDITFDVEVERSVLKRLGQQNAIHVQVRGFISKFVLGCGRQSSDRQFLFVNGRPCNLHKIQKAINETYRQFNATQTPFVIADIILPTNTCDINVSPDKRTIFLHSEANIIVALKAELEKEFATSRSTYVVNSGPSTLQMSLHDQTQEEDDENDANDGAPITGTPLLVTHDQRISSPTVSSPSLAQSTQEIDVDSDTAGTQGQTSLAAPAAANAIPINASQSGKVPLFLPDEEETEEIPGHAKLYARHSTPVASSSKDDLQASDQARTSSSSPSVSNPNEDIHSINFNVAPPASRAHVAPNIGTYRPLSGTQKKGTLLSYFGASSSTSITPRDHPTSSHGSRQLPSESPQAKRPRVDEPRPALGRESSPPLQRPEKRRKPMSPEPIQIDDAEGILNIELDELMDDDREEPALDGTTHTMTTQPRMPASSRRISTTSLALSNNEIIDLTNIVTSPPISHPIASETAGVDGDTVLTAAVNIETISTLWNSLLPTVEQNTRRDHTPDAGGIEAPAEAAEEVLSRSIHKTDFSRMQILGQFNLGFIIARLRGGDNDNDDVQNDDLFIIDQHASDEKFNFETLQETTKMETQRLLRPRPLELTAADELLAIERLDVLRQNGFDLQIDEDAPAHQRVKLTAIPVSKNTAFGVEDLEELIHLLRNSSPGEMVRCSKVRAMFAMRACRKSVMIGDALTARQMKEIVSRMGTMDQPWNCPHGRPTMRHLMNLNFREQDNATVDWNRFMSCAQ